MQTVLRAAALDVALTATGGTMTPEIRLELDSINLLEWKAADEIIDAIQMGERREAELKQQAAPHVQAAAPFMARAKAAAAAVELLKEYLRKRMEKEELKELTGPVHACRLQKNSQPTFQLADPDTIPPELAKTVVSLDTDKARVAFKANALPVGITGTVGQQLRIDR